MSLIFSVGCTTHHIPSDPAAETTTTAVLPSFEVSFDLSGKDGKMECGDGKTVDFTAPTSLTFIGLTTCVVTINGAKTEVTLVHAASVKCVEADSAVTCSGGRGVSRLSDFGSFPDCLANPAYADRVVSLSDNGVILPCAGTEDLEFTVSWEAGARSGPLTLHGVNTVVLAVDAPSAVVMGKEIWISREPPSAEPLSVRVQVRHP